MQERWCKVWERWVEGAEDGRNIGMDQRAKYDNSLRIDDDKLTVGLQSYRWYSRFTAMHA